MKNTKRWITDFIKRYNNFNVKAMEKGRILVIVFYCVLAISFIGLLAYTLYYQPLFPFELDDLGWCKMWLGTTVADYYVLAASLSSIIVATEGWIFGALWVLAICMIGSPVSCFYIVYKICKRTNLKISDEPEIFWDNTGIKSIDRHTIWYKIQKFILQSDVKIDLKGRLCIV